MSLTEREMVSEKRKVRLEGERKEKDQRQSDYHWSHPSTSPKMAAWDI